MPHTKEGSGVSERCVWWGGGGTTECDCGAPTVLSLLIRTLQSERGGNSTQVVQHRAVLPHYTPTGPPGW
jgi:hypothetical protein